MNDRLEELFDLRFDWVKGYFGSVATKFNVCCEADLIHLSFTCKIVCYKANGYKCDCGLIRDVR